jgi:ABC-type nitrate/sulfonate/bicarbonate transport system ATPase subunit
VALAAALAGRPPLLLLDEPMSQLDRLSRRRLLDSGLFDGRTLVIISHDRNGLDLAEGDADAEGQAVHAPRATVLDLNAAPAETAHAPDRAEAALVA